MTEFSFMSYHISKYTRHCVLNKKALGCRWPCAKDEDIYKAVVVLQTLERHSLKKEPFNSQFLPGAEREQREALIKFSSMSSTAGLLCSFQNDIAGQQWTQDLNQQLPYKHSWLSHMHFELYSLFYSAAIGHYVHFKYKKNCQV